ncbi:6-phosphofructokinase [Vicingus serpentipes]|uniref:ATP-dependent 6-phosphofructokinase n=1 Tax=Vicingus serpentipes TaxID=1926625 RepID=A0A5C6RZ49_9FLAO|nr:6-phosphofructokinase [Vicingus serpentipes]TXB66920.1 6-phosphofructokinase [Vicingus serpentipes]
MKKIGVFTSGGDAPGMNAAIRAVVRTCFYNNIEPYGIYEGYKGLIAGEIYLLTSKDVGNVIQRGGTFLKSARCKEFHTKKGRQQAYDNIKKHELDGIVAIGGDGTFTGANIFNREFNIPFVGLPGTIDNDLFGTDYTIGYDTALNTVIEAVDKIRDTANSHNRLFLVEVMGRDAGFIALRSGIAVGAEAILIPETQTYINELVAKLESGTKNHKNSMIVIVAEGDDAGGAYEIAEQVKQKCPNYDARVTVLGHIQRGGSPSALDRVLASRLGNAAVDALLANKTNLMIGVVNNQISYTPFSKAIKHHQKLNTDLLDLAEILSY